MNIASIWNILAAGIITLVGSLLARLFKGSRKQIIAISGFLILLVIVVPHMIPTSSPISISVPDATILEPSTRITPAYQDEGLLLDPAPLPVGKPISHEIMTYSLQYLAPYAAPRGLSQEKMVFFSLVDMQRALGILELSDRNFSNDGAFTNFVLNAFAQSSQFTDGPVGEAIEEGISAKFPVILINDENTLVLYRVLNNGQLDQIAYGPIVQTKLEGSDPNNPGVNPRLLILLFNN